MQTEEIVKNGAENVVKDGTAMAKKAEAERSMEENNNTDIISIVVPIYNGEACLMRCIRSLQNQTYPALDIVLVDDGSQDRTLEICRQAAKGDARIQVIHKENGGVASARNAGIAAAKGRWLMLIDGDDYIHPRMAEKLLSAARESKAQAAICGFERVYADGAPREIHAWEGKTRDGEKRERETRERKNREGENQKGEIWAGNLHQFGEEMLLPLYRNLMLRTQSNKLYDLEIIRKRKLFYPEGFSINEDIWFCIRYLSFCRRVVCIPGSYLYYWQNSPGDSQISRYHPEGVESCFLLLQAAESFLKRAECSPQVQNALRNEMLFHICGFAGHIYYRTVKSRRECLASIRELAGRKEFRKLLRGFKPEGVKNRTAAFLLGHGLCRVYHWMCLVLYGRQRKENCRKMDMDKRKDRKPNGTE